MSEWNGEERRQSRLHEDDIKIIVSEISKAMSNHLCRFLDIKTEDMKNVFPFMLSFKKLTEKTGLFIWYLIIGAVIAGIISLTALGFWKKAGGN